jgi:hypothetical protein
MPLQDLRLTTALADDGSARSMLNELHQTVLASPDANLLASALARYIAMALLRQSKMAKWRIGAYRGIDQQTVLMQMISQVMKQSQDQAKAIINNLRA